MWWITAAAQDYRCCLTATCFSPFSLILPEQERCSCRQTIYQRLFTEYILYIGRTEDCHVVTRGLPQSKIGDLGCNQHSPEETSGIFSLGVFFWLNKLFVAGYRHIFTIESLYPLDSTFDAQALHEEFAKKMDYTKLKGDKFGLLKVLVRTLWVQLLLPIPPRAALIAFYICQPLFIESLVMYLSHSDPDPNVGYGLIGAAIIIYSGIGISYALYWYGYLLLRHISATHAISLGTATTDCGQWSAPYLSLRPLKPPRESGWEQAMIALR